MLNLVILSVLKIKDNEIRREIILLWKIGPSDRNRKHQATIIRLISDWNHEISCNTTKKSQHYDVLAFDFRWQAIPPMANVAGR